MKPEDFQMKTHDWIALYVLTALLIFGGMSYFVAPKDAESTKAITNALIDALGMILSFKFGVHVATPPVVPGSTISQETKSTVQTPPS